VAIREATFIVLAAILLSTAYNALLRKGIFGSPGAQKQSAPAVDEVAPVFITLEEALAFYNASQGTFVDARHEYDFGLGHIKGAVNIPLKEFEAHAETYVAWPKDRILIVYCDGAECNSSIELAKKFSAAGFTHVNIFFGGWTEWQMHGDATEK